MSRKEKEQEQHQPKQRCKECGRKVGVQDGKLVQHKCEKSRKEKN